MRKIEEIEQQFSRQVNDGLWELVPVVGKLISIDAITSMKKLKFVELTQSLVA